MGTDYLTLFDRRTAEIIMATDESGLATLVDLRTRSESPLVWGCYWNDDEEALTAFSTRTPASERLKKLLETTTLNEIKRELVTSLCQSNALLHLDYWGCWAEVFPPTGPPAALPIETFLAPISQEANEQEPSGAYLLTLDNVDSILLSLNGHRDELQIMGDSEIARLRDWGGLCKEYEGYSILYQIDF